MTTRILPRDEWSKLAGTELEPAWPYLAQRADDDAFVAVIEDGNRIIACWAAAQEWRVDGFWIHPDFRRTGRVAHRGLQFMLAQLHERGARCATTSALTEDVRRLAVHIGGVQLPGDHYVFPVRGL